MLFPKFLRTSNLNQLFVKTGGKNLEQPLVLATWVAVKTAFEKCDIIIHVTFRNTKFSTPDHQGPMADLIQ